MQLFFVFTSIFALLTACALPIGLVGVRLVLKDFLNSSENRHSFYALSPVVGMAILVVFISILLSLGLQMEVIAAVVSVLCVMALVFLTVSLKKVDWQELIKIFLPLFLVFLLVYLVYLAPLIFAGHVGITGYNVANDSAMHTVVGEYLGDHGLSPPKSTMNSYNEVAWKIIFKAGYPLGFHQILGFAYTFLGMRAFKLYNAVMAYLSALTVPVVFFMLRKFKLSSKYSYVGAFLVTLAYLHLGYLVQGFAPQVSALAFLYLALILSYLLLTGRAGLVLTILAAIAVTASFLFYSFVSLVWIFPFIAFLFAYVLWDKRGLVAVKGLSLKLLGLVVFSIAFSSSALLLGKQYFFHLIGAVRQQTLVLGNLPGGFVSFLTLFNVWFGPDYRYGLPTLPLKTANYALSLIAVVLFAVGLTYVWRRRIALPFLMLLTWFLPLLTLRILDKPYAHGKILHMGTLLFSAAIFCGVASLVGYISSNLTTLSLPRILSGLVLLGIILLYGGGFAASDYLALRGAAPSPEEKFADLEWFNEKLRFRSRPTLFVEREDWGAYFLRDLDASSPLDQGYFGRPVCLKPGHTRWTINDFNSFEYEDIAHFGLLIFSRLNDVALIPPNYELVYRDTYYSLYEKKRALSGRIEEHISFGDSADGLTCLSIRSKSNFLTDMPMNSHSAALLLAIHVNGETDVETEKWNLTKSSWYVWPANPDYVVNTGNPEAQCSGTFALPEHGIYEIYATAVPNNGLEVLIDGKSLGSIKRGGELGDEIYYGRASLEAGQHEATLVNEGSGAVNYVSKIKLSRFKPQGEVIVMDVGGRAVMCSVALTPGLEQIVLNGTEGLAQGKLRLEIYNPTNYPLQLQWLEVLRTPYELEYLKQFNSTVQVRSIP